MRERGRHVHEPPSPQSRVTTFPLAALLPSRRKLFWSGCWRLACPFHLFAKPEREPPAQSALHPMRVFPIRAEEVEDGNLHSWKTTKKLPESRRGGSATSYKLAVTLAARVRLLFSWGNEFCVFRIPLFIERRAPTKLSHPIDVWRSLSWWRYYCSFPTSSVGERVPNVHYAGVVLLVVNRASRMRIFLEAPGNCHTKRSWNFYFSVF